MASTTELKKIKLNITNIKSVLLDGKKAVDEKKKDREDFLQKLAEEKKQKQEEKGLEQPIKPTQKKPELKSPVKSSMGLMDRIFNFVSAIVGGIIVKSLPEIIETFKKVFEKVKPFFEKMVEFLKPVFTSIGELFKGKGSYESEKEKVNEDVEKAQLASKDIDGQVDELNKAGKDVANENKGLAANSDALSKTGKGLEEDPEKRKDDEKEETNDEEEQIKDDSKISSNEGISDGGLTPTNVEVNQSTSNSTTVNVEVNESTSDTSTVTSENSDNTSDDVNFLNKKSKSELSGVQVITAPVKPVREDFPNTRAGAKAFSKALKKYNIQFKEYKKQTQNLIKPSESNKNSLNALNTTDGLTSINGTGSNTVIIQRQIVQTNVPIPV
tara:strand:- start:1117 stop:2268 length:1152 start_codon:yes stop_codon:yes gene_type:complete